MSLSAMTGCTSAGMLYPFCESQSFSALGSVD